MQAILILYENRGKFFPLAKLALCTRIIIDGEKAHTVQNLARHEKHEVPQRNFGRIVLHKLVKQCRVVLHRPPQSSGVSRLDC